MSTDTKPSEHCKENDNPLVDVMEKNVRAIVRITAILTGLSGRLDALERRVREDDAFFADADTNVDGEPLREPSDGDELPPFAIGSDGRAILNLSYLEDADLNAYDHFVGAVLSETETSELLEYLADGAADAAGRLGGWIRKTRKASSEGEGGAP